MSFEEQRIVESVIGPEADGLRLDQFLRTRFTYRSRNEWQDTIRRGELKINGREIRASKILRTGDKLSFNPGKIEEPEVNADWSLIHESERYLAINKPGQLPAHPSGRFFKHTLWYLLREKYGELHIVNRLDRETSGITIAAKDADAAKTLSGLFADRRTVKKYIAFVFGKFPETLVADGFLSDDRKSGVRKNGVFPERRVTVPNMCGRNSVCSGTDGS